MAEKDVKHKVPAPEFCPHCGSDVEYVNNKEIYGRSYGRWPYMYRCVDKQCDSYVGCHPNTTIPLGSLANREMREARKSGKKRFFDVLSLEGWSRSKGYKWLSEQMGIPASETHWGMFDVARARQASEICRKQCQAYHDAQRARAKA